MPKLGSHQSISGGLENAVYAAAKLGFDTVQLFSKNSNQWKAKAIDDKAVEQFQKAIETTGIVTPLIHDSYLINLASPKSELFEKSLNAFSDELKRAAKLNVDWVVMHPGSYTEDTENNGLSRIAKALNDILADVTLPVGVLLETTAGQGTNLGWKFEHLAEIIAKSSCPERLAVCFDTCHAFAAGYDFRSEKTYDETFTKFDDIIGLEKLRAFHLNDSVKDLGCRVDRHAHIGWGKIGQEAFSYILNDPRFYELPMYLETPKGETNHNGKLQDWDSVNLQVLQSLINKTH
ncbi:MAG: deoxyribonuclease IV [Planctomycetia bacterium]|nr:deoxyribonuclease IV [Planctomycetia bacterium]